MTERANCHEHDQNFWADDGCPVCNVIAERDAALARAEDAEMAIALVLEQADLAVQSVADNCEMEGERLAIMAAVDAVRALAPDAGIKAVAELRKERDELQQVFDQQWKADQRAIAEWRKENPGNDLVWPDSVRLSAWALAERTLALACMQAAEADNAALRARLAEMEGKVGALVEAIRPLGNMAMWTESAGDEEAVIMTVGTVRKIRAALAAAGGDA